MRNVFIGGGTVVSGVSIGGGSLSGPTAEKTVGGVRIRFQTGENLTHRQVQIGSGMSTSVGPGMSSSMSVNGISVRSSNGQLWVNGERVDFSQSPEDAAAAKAKSDAALAGVRARFPGVEFSGEPGPNAIGPDVSIARGAQVKLSATSLSGETEIGASAVIGDRSRIRDSRVDGVIGQAEVGESIIHSGARVDGESKVNGSVLQGYAAVSGNSDVSNSLLGIGAKVSGNARVSSSVVEEGARVSGNATVRRSVVGGAARISGNASVTASELPAGQKLSGNRTMRDQGRPVTARTDFDAVEYAHARGAADSPFRNETDSTERSFGGEVASRTSQASRLGTSAPRPEAHVLRGWTGGGAAMDVVMTDIILGGDPNAGGTGGSFDF